MSLLLRSRCAGLLTLLLVLTATIDASARGPRGGGGRGAAGGFSGGGRSLGGVGHAAEGFAQGAPGGRTNFQPGQLQPGQFQGGQFTPGQHTPGQFNPSQLSGAPSSLPATTQQALAGRANPAANPAQVQQWLSANAPGAATARNGQYAQAAANQWQSGPPPFSPAWYAQHPNAWQATHPHADVAVAATAAGVTAWLAGAAYATPAGSSTSTTVVYNNYEESPVVVEEQQPVAPTPTTTAAIADEWLALGVYELKPQPGAAASQVLQLSVNRAAQLRGAYYDLLSGATQNVSGSIDPSSGAARWSLDASPDVAFATTLNELTAGAGAVTVTLPNGQQTLRIERQGSP